MRFAFAGFDLFHGMLETFASAGWKPVSLFSFVTDGQVNSNAEIVSYATRHGLPLQLSRIDEAALHARSMMGMYLSPFVGSASADGPPAVVTKTVR